MIAIYTRVSTTTQTTDSQLTRTLTGGTYCHSEGMAGCSTSSPIASPVAPKVARQRLRPIDGSGTTGRRLALSWHSNWRRLANAAWPTWPSSTSSEFSTSHRHVASTFAPSQAIDTRQQQSCGELPGGNILAAVARVRRWSLTVGACTDAGLRAARAAWRCLGQVNEQECQALAACDRTADGRIAVGTGASERELGLPRSSDRGVGSSQAGDS